MARQVMFRMEVDDHQLREWFVYAGYKVRDLRTPLRKWAHDYYIPMMHLQFDTEGARTGGWFRLTHEYAKQKALDGFGEKPILERTGAMKRDVLALSAWRFMRMGANYAPNDHYRRAEYKDTSYPEYLQEGGSNRLPPRPWLVVEPQDEFVLGATIEDWLKDLREANRARSGFSNLPDDVIPGWEILI